MQGRQSAWSNPKLQKLARTKFIPAADEVHRLQNCDSSECQFFQGIAEQDQSINPGPTDTQQGTWVATPSGKLLASINTNAAGPVLDILNESLEKWKNMPEDERLLDSDRFENERASKPDRMEDHYPENGLVLTSYSRDLPRENPSASGWKADAWNRDFVWYTRAEHRQFLPEHLEPGATRQVPKKLTHRLARFHLIDNVRGQTRYFPSSAVRKAQLTSTVTEIDDETVRLKLRGESKTRFTGKWSVCGYEDMDNPKKRERGFHATLRGHATYDRSTEQFRSFELLAAGERWGGTQYNGRCNDLEPAPMGVFFKMAGDRPSDRVAPAFFWKYQWE